MEAERIFSADQIKVHPDLTRTIKDYTKAVIKANPENITEFSWVYFKNKVDEDEKRRKQEQEYQQEE